MTATDEAVQELNAMLDDGVNVEISDDTDGAYRLRVVLDDEGCADCLVPDDALRMITKDALERRGLAVSSIEIEHAPV